MSTNFDIQFSQEIQKHLLIVNEEIKNELDLRDDQGRPLLMVHENKMQLEWLSQKIIVLYTEIKQVIEFYSTRLKKRKRVAIFLLLGTSAVALFNNEIARLFHLHPIYINVPAFAIGIVCVMQLLKYYALGFNGYGSDLESNLKIIELKKIIQEQYCG